MKFQSKKVALALGMGGVALVAGGAAVAQDINRITHPDLFEVADEHGSIVTSVGSVPLEPGPRAPLLKAALAGRAESRAIAQRGTHVLLMATPVIADGRGVGALLMGTEVGGELAAHLRALTSSEVTFLSEGHSTRTTLEERGDREGGRHSRAMFECSGSWA